jgi:hypothetical protein
MPSARRTVMTGSNTFSPPPAVTVIRVKRCYILDHAVEMMKELDDTVMIYNLRPNLTPRAINFKVFLEEMVKNTKDILKMQLFIVKNLKANNCIKKLVPALKIKSSNACHNLLEAMEKAVEDGGRKENDYMDIAKLVQVLHEKNLRYFKWIENEYIFEFL